MSALNYEEICNAIKNELSEEHQLEVKIEKGYILIVSIYNKRKVVFKQKLEE